jgi:DNA replication initiation complex subunit (GINS family)
MAFADEINYEKISTINKKERKSAKLVTLDPGFYNVLIEHLKKLQGEYNTRFLESPTSTEALLLNNEICKLDNMIKEIYTRRERKIILAALISHGCIGAKASTGMCNYTHKRIEH